MGKHKVGRESDENGEVRWKEYFLTNLDQWPAAAKGEQEKIRRGGSGRDCKE